MEFSPSKRRKISPTTSVSHYALTQPGLREREDEVRTTPSRASYLSPTKATLARFNPGLLPRPGPKHDSAQKASRHLKKFCQVPRTHVNGVEEAETSNGRTMHRIDVGEDEAARDGPTTLSLASNIVNGPRGLSASPRRTSKAPSDGVQPATPSWADGSDVRASLAYSARATPNTLHTKVGKQLKTGVQENVAADPYPGGKVRNGKPIPVITQRLQEGELQLPPPPDYLLHEAEQRPPKGLLFSSPIRRQKRRKKKGSDARSSTVTSFSSPQKPRDIQQQKRIIEKPASLRLQSHVPDANTHVASHPVQAEFDPNVLQNYQELSRLRVQLKAIQRDVTQLETTATQLPASQLIEQEPKQANEELLQILLSNDPTHTPSVASPKKPSLTDHLSRFLPFSKRHVTSTPPPPPPILSRPSFKPSDLLKPVTGLNLFSPLGFTYTPACILPCSISEPFLRCQPVTLASAHQTLVVKLEVTTNVSTQNVTNVVIQEISSFAESELGPWIRARAAERDMTAIAWAVGHYWDIAVRRARCWTRCEKSFGQLLQFTNLGSNRNLIHSEKDARSERKALPRPDGTHLGFWNNVLDSDGPSDSEEPILRTQLHSHIGRQSIPFMRHEVSLLVTWRISFDWIGDAKSDVSACVGYPESWTQIDETGSLQEMGKVFDILLKSKGVSQAIQVVVGLLFSD